MRFPLFLPLALLALLAPACTHFTPHPLDPAAAATRLTDRHLAAQSWTLSSLTAEATENHPSISLARAKYHTALAAAHTAAAPPNPTLALSTQSVTPSTQWITGTYGLDFDWTFETAGKSRARLNQAHAEARAAAATVIDTTWTVRAALRQAFLQLSAANQRQALLQQALRHQEALLHLLNHLLQTGAAAQRSLAPAQILLAQLQRQAADAAKSSLLARAALAEALGLSLPSLAQASFSFPAFPSSNPTLPSRTTALTHRADILAALATYAAAEANLRLEIAKQYPDFHLNPGYSLDASENKWALGFGLTLPLLNRNQGPINQAEAQRAQAEAAFHAVQAQALADFDRATATLTAAHQSLALTKTALATQTKLTAREAHLLEVGASDRSALLSAQVEQALAAAAHSDALADVLAALGSLEAATQTPIPL